MPNRRPPPAKLQPGPWDGWRGVVLITATYVYFLIFAQFGFLKRLDELGIVGSHLQLVMSAMAVGGILSSLLAPRITAVSDPVSRLRCALGGCAAAALLATLRLTPLSGVAVSLSVGISLGLLTVTLVANLDLWMGPSRPLLKVGLGTGLGYFLCNVPALFTASPREIAFAAVFVCLVAIASADTAEASAPTSRITHEPNTHLHFALLLAWFTALIWLDSAAFFIIQNSPPLKSGTWAGAGHLWRTGALHLAAALGSAWLIGRRGLSFTLLCAFASLSGACLVLLNPAHASIAALLYPTGVSLYSVALVAAPAFLLQTSSRADRARKAGWIYAVAGWIGSAMGIGMGQNLHRVPPAFIVAAGLLFFVPWAWRVGRSYLPQTAAVLVSLGAAFALQHLLGSAAASRKTVSPQSLIERGRSVYISEGCIHCHSQYVRPHSNDVLIWGPTRDVEAIRREKPPLIGNRRQGPDLSEVGSRRSPLWLRIHFMNPRDVSYDSIMPRYAYLFREDRGEALIAYVASLRTPQSADHLRHITSEWKPTSGAFNSSDDAAGTRLFGHYCATCHLGDGRARGTWSSSFKRLPPDLGTDKLLYVPDPGTSPEARKTKIAQIIKFGLPGTDMPGHEYLPDADIEAIATSVNGLRTMREASVVSPPKSSRASSRVCEKHGAFTCLKGYSVSTRLATFAELE